MTRRRLLRAALGLGALAALGPVAAGVGIERLAADRGLRWERRHLVGFGTTLSIEAAHRDAARLRRGLDDAVAVLQRIDAELSLFRDDSALAILNRTGRLEAAPAELAAVLAVARRVAQRSAGAFDPTVQPLWDVFAQAQAAGGLPAAGEIAAARGRVGWDGLVLSPGGGVHFSRPGMAVTLNGIAQGYAADRVRGVLARAGIRDALVDAGEYAMLGHDPRDAPWVLGLADPRDEARLLARLFADGRCVATSADNATAFSADRRYHHIFDPHTGVSPPDLASVTVAAASGALADALTKVMFVGGPARVADLAREWRVDVLWVDKQGRRAATPGLSLA